MSSSDDPMMVKDSPQKRCDEHEASKNDSVAQPLHLHVDETKSFGGAAPPSSKASIKARSRRNEQNINKVEDTARIKMAMSAGAEQQLSGGHPRLEIRERHIFHAQYDEDGVYFYQAFNDQIGVYAAQHQRFAGCPGFNPERMTWIKPSFAWVLYRSGYADKHNQTRILRIKLPHNSVASLLAQCDCKHGGGGSKGRIQWDPERDLYCGENPGSAKNKEPRKMLKTRAIQIGLGGCLSQEYVAAITQIEDVTELAKKVKQAHQRVDYKQAMEELKNVLPVERAYVPRLDEAELERLQIISCRNNESIGNHTK